MYDFDFVSEGLARGTNDVKWDTCDPGVIPMWVAEMDFPAAPCILKALRESELWQTGATVRKLRPEND